MQGGVASPGKSVTVTLSNGGTFSGTTDANGELKFSYVPPSNATVALLSAICSGCQNTATQTITVESADAPNMCLAGDSSTLVGNPIAPATGEKIETQVDWVDNAAHPLTLSRHYKSYGFGGSLAGLGNYWSHNFAGSISGTATDNSRAVRLGDGTSALFNRADAASPWVGNTVSDQLAVNATGPLFTRASDDSRWQFDAAGALLSITRRNGWAVTLAYANGHISSATNAFGRALLFTYDAQGRLASVTTPDAKVLSYTLDGPSRLTGVLYPDGKSKSYVYENSSFANALTGIVDEAGQRFASFAYDFSGRAVSTTHANGAQNYGLSFTSPANGAVGSLQAAPVPANSPLYQASAQVVTPLGGAQTLSFQGGDGQIRLKGSNQAFSGAPFAARAFDYPAAPSLPTLETDFLGVQTMFTWDINRRLPLSTTKAANRPEAQTTSTQWHATLRLPVLVIEPGRSTASTYDALGNKLTETVTDTATGQARATAWSYNAQGLAATRTDPRGFVSTFDYDAVGNLTGFKNPLNQETRFTHDAAGRVLSQTDPSGLATIYAYDVRGRVLSIAQGGTGAATETTSFSYTPTGQVASVAQLSGQAVAYTYDAAQRLVGVADNRGNSITYTLDAMGNRLREEVKDSTGAIALLTTRTVNQLNRLASQSGAAGQTSQFAYDANAEPAGSTDPLNQTTRQSLDALRRPATTTLADNAVAIQAWSALNQISTVTDPKGVAPNSPATPLARC